MQYKNIEIHNVACLKEDPNGGVSWLRFPQEVASSFEGGETAYNVARYATGVELRFVIESGDSASITMSKLEDDGTRNTFNVYRGGIQGSGEEGEVTTHAKTFVIRRSENLDALRRAYPNNPFSAEVVRIVFDRGRYRLLGVSDNVRPPRQDEVPSKSILFYGSSITHGSLALDMPHSFASVIGRRLHYDVYNLGLPGQCRIEHNTIDYLSSLAWNVAVLELGINVLDWKEEKIEERVDYVLHNLAAKNPQKPVIMISPFYCYKDLLYNGTCVNRWRSIMEERIRRANLPNVTYINGVDLLDKAEYLTADILHPGIDGMQKIADGLYPIIAEAVSKYE